MTVLLILVLKIASSHLFSQVFGGRGWGWGRGEAEFGGGRGLGWGGRGS